MKWFDKIFRKKNPEPLSSDGEDKPLDIPLRETEEWIPVWHGWGQWDTGMWLSYTIYYSPNIHKFELTTRGFRADEHSTYHRVALPNLFRVQRTLYQFTPQEIIQQVIENNEREADEIRNKKKKPAIERLTDEELENKIQENLSRENYREVARLQRELDKRRGI